MKLLTAPEAAAVLRVRKQRVYQLVRAGLLPATRMGRQVRISEPSLRRWINDGGKALPGGWRRDPTPTSGGGQTLNP